MLTDDTKLALESPADGDMAKIKEKSKIIIALKDNDRKKSYKYVPMCEVGFLKSYVDNHNSRMSQAARRNNSNNSKWSFANGVRRQY